MIGRRDFVRVFGSALVVGASRLGWAQQTPVRRIGFLASGAPTSPAELEQHWAPLKELGWIEGKNIVFLRRYSYDRPELLQSYAEELVRMKVDLIVTEGTDATLAAKNATKTIPIVIRSAGDPVRSGLVASLARPGGNITGYAVTSLDVEVKLLQLSRELLPSLQRVGRLDGSTNVYYHAVRGELERAYRAFGLEAIFVEIARPSEAENAIAETVRWRAQALVLGGANLIEDARMEIVAASLKHALPVIGGNKLIVEAGALMSYFPSVTELRRRGAAFVDRILRGANPADLPIEQPSEFDLMINLRTARALRINVPSELLLRAVYVVR